MKCNFPWFNPMSSEYTACLLKGIYEYGPCLAHKDINRVPSYCLSITFKLKTFHSDNCNGICLAMRRVTQ